MASKKGVVMYYDILEQLEDFTDEQFGKITRAIINYDKTGEIPAFKILKPTLDRNKQEYEAICAKRREAGSLGGKQKVANASKCYQNVANLADNDNDNDIDKENDIENDIFNYWNKKDIIKHRNMNDDIHKAIEKALKIYSVDEIKTYIDRYKTVIDDKSFFFDYKWKLNEFLSRKEGISAFADDGSKWNSYLSQRKQSNNYFQQKNKEYVEQNREYLERDDEELF